MRILQGRERNKHTVDKRVLVEGKWMTEPSGACERVRRRNGEKVPLGYLKDGQQLIVFTDASNLARGWALTPEPREELGIYW